MGYWFKYENGTLEVLKESMVIMKGVRKNNLYSLVGKTIIGVTSIVTQPKIDKIRFWHMRLGYFIKKKKGLIEISKHNLMCGDKIDKLNFVNNVFWGNPKESNLAVQ